MLSRKIGTERVFMCSLLCVFTFLSCSETTADESEIFIQANIAWHGQYDEITARLGEVWMGYIPIPGIINVLGTERFAVSRVNYYRRVDGNMIFMGHVDKTGVHDKNGNLLREAPRYLGSGQGRVVGIESQFIAVGSIAIRFIVAPSERDGGIDHYWSTEVWESIDFDIENATIKLFDRMNWRP